MQTKIQELHFAIAFSYFPFLPQQHLDYHDNNIIWGTRPHLENKNGTWFQLSFEWVNLQPFHRKASVVTITLGRIRHLGNQAGWFDWQMWNEHNFLKCYRRWRKSFLLYTVLTPDFNTLQNEKKSFPFFFTELIRFFFSYFFLHIWSKKHFFAYL